MRRRRASDWERGAIAVEAALVLTFVLVPLLLGVIQYGSWFWRAQDVSNYEPRIPSGGVSGRFSSCAELVDRVKSTVQGILPDVGGSTGLVPLSDITVDVVDVLPTVGVVVRVGVEVPVDGLVSLIPLPNDGRVLTEFTARLDDVTVATESC